jgi:hypothetical protein
MEVNLKRRTGDGTLTQIHLHPTAITLSNNFHMFGANATSVTFNNDAILGSFTGIQKDS